MSEDRKFKKELKKIDRLLNASAKVYGNNGLNLDLIDEKNTGKAIEYCMKAKDIIDNSYNKERHNKPHPLLARHVGINARSSREIPHENNEDMIKDVVFRRLFNFLLNLTGNGYREDKADLMLNVLDEQTKDSLQKLGIGKENIMKYVEGVLMDYGNRISNAYKEMEKLNENKQYELGLLERFCNNVEKFKKVRERFDPEGKFVGEDKMYDKALDYASDGLDSIIKGLVNQDPTNPKSVYYAIFGNQGMRDQEFIKQFLEEKASNLDKKRSALSGLILGLRDKVIGDVRYIGDRNKVFAGIMEKKQDEMYKTALELAEKGDKNYKIYLNNFINMTANYSKLLDENNEDIAKMFGCINPDAHIMLNEAYKDKDILPLHEFYKNEIPEVAKAVLDVKLAYVRAKNKKDEKKYGKNE